MSKKWLIGVVFVLLLVGGVWGLNSQQNSDVKCLNSDYVTLSDGSWTRLIFNDFNTAGDILKSYLDIDSGSITFSDCDYYNYKRCYFDYKNDSSDTFTSLEKFSSFFKDKSTTQSTVKDSELISFSNVTGANVLISWVYSDADFLTSRSFTHSDKLAVYFANNCGKNVVEKYCLPKLLAFKFASGVTNVSFNFRKGWNVIIFVLDNPSGIIYFQDVKYSIDNRLHFFSKPDKAFVIPENKICIWSYVDGDTTLIDEEYSPTRTGLCDNYQNCIKLSDKSCVPFGEDNNIYGDGNSLCIDSNNWLRCSASNPGLNSLIKTTGQNYTISGKTYHCKDNKWSLIVKETGSLCTDGKDNDFDGKTDSQEDECKEVCNNGIDDSDSDTLTDCNDPDCWDDSECHDEDCGDGKKVVWSYVLLNEEGKIAAENNFTSGCCKENQCVNTNGCVDNNEIVNVGNMPVLLCGPNTDFSFCYVDTKDQIIGDYVCKQNGTKYQWTEISSEINCTDGIDNDKDGETDCYDEKCWNERSCVGKDCGNNDVIIRTNFWFSDKSVPTFAGKCCKSDGCFFGDKCYLLNDLISNKSMVCDFNNTLVLCSSYLENTFTASQKFFCNGTNWIPNVPETNCADDVDNNGNGFVDCLDPTCNNIIGDSNGNKCEYQTELTCNDGFDNDRDQISYSKSSKLPAKVAILDTGVKLNSNQSYSSNMSALQNEISPPLQNSFAGQAVALPSEQSQSSFLSRAWDAFTQLLNRDTAIAGQAVFNLNSVGTDCSDSDCLGKFGPNKGKCCTSGQDGATCGTDKELHETNCEDTQDNDQDGKIDCIDPDCNAKRCGGDDNYPMQCSNFQCVKEQSSEVAYGAPKVTQTVERFSHKQLLEYLHNGQVFTGVNSDCNSFCKAQNMICGFADGGRKACAEGGSAKCTCYPK